ncbi:Abi family protein [Corynebacterium parakroppenstedtii]|uniref:Abi family protein n=1 Tax=Corynebacterium parakroppenstedtii TaxID=2828363 RepID=UPI0030ECAF64
MTFEDQVELLRTRGMRIENSDHAKHVLARLNYYRLSGYWYPMRRYDYATGTRCDDFVEGASFDLVVRLYEFDERLRHDVFMELDRVEMAIRTMLGYELGRFDPFAYLDAKRLKIPAQDPEKGWEHDTWLGNYQDALERSKEVFVTHHNEKYGGELPIWAAVEVMDWGMLSHLFGVSPDIVRNRIAKQCALDASQLESWLYSLNVVRNLAAHHARMFNRRYDVKPKLSDDQRLNSGAWKRDSTFGLLSLIQYLHRQLDLSPAKRLPALLNTYPDNTVVRLGSTGAPPDWSDLPLWKC